MSATLALDDDELLEEWQEQPQAAAVDREAVADLQLIDEHGTVSHSYELCWGDNVIGREDSSDVALTSDATVSSKHACITIERPAAVVSASVLAAPFITTSGTLLDLDAITVTDLNSSNHTRLFNSLSASLAASAAQPPIRLQPNKPRVLRHQQLLWLGKQRCRFLLRQYDAGVQRAAEQNGSHTPPANTDPNATQAYPMAEEEGTSDQQAIEELQATIAYNDESDDQPQPAPHDSAYNDSPDEQLKSGEDANTTQCYPEAEWAGEVAAVEDGDPAAATLSYEVELDLVEDEEGKKEGGAKAGSEVMAPLGGGSETSPIIMSLASSHSSHGVEEEEEVDQQPLSALAHSPSAPTDAAGNKKASARTRVKQPSIVATAEEQQSSMEEEEREQRRRAEEEKDRRLRQEAEEQKAEFERDVQQKAQQREEKRRREEEEERRYEEEKRKERQQEEADRQREAQQEENERVKREAKEKREAEKREKARRDREVREEEEEERERKKLEKERKTEEDKKQAEEERKQSEEAAAAAKEENRQKKEAEEAERVITVKLEDEERQRQLVAADKQRLQQMAASQIGWKSKPSKKATTQQTNKTSPPSKKANTDNPTSPHEKSQVKSEEVSRAQAERKTVASPAKQDKAEEKKEASVSEQTVEEKKETKGRRGKRKSAEEEDSKQPNESEPKKRASRRKTADVGRVIPIPITQPAEEQWDAADFTPAAGEEEQRADVEMEQRRVEERMEEVKVKADEVEPENPMVTTADQLDQPDVDTVRPDTSTAVERSSSRGKRKREARSDEKEDEEGQQRSAMTDEENTAVSTGTNQEQPPVVAAVSAEGDGPSNKVAGRADAATHAKPTNRKKVKHANKQADEPTTQYSTDAHTSTTALDSSEQLAVNTEQHSSPATAPATDTLSSRSSATLAAMDVLEDMDTAQALTVDSMATTDEEVSPANAAAPPKKATRRSKKAAVTKAADEEAKQEEAQRETSSESKRTTGPRKRQLDESVADDSSMVGEQRGARYSHRTRSTGTVHEEMSVTRTRSSTSTPNQPTRRTSSKSTTPPHSTVHTRSSSSSHPTTPAPVLLFTVIDHTTYSADIDRLHGSITTDPLVATHLITNKVRRTDKFLIAYSITPHLQSLEWLEGCLKSGRWEAEQAGRLVDAEAEVKWGFVLNERRVRSDWMGGWQVWCSDSVVPSRASMKGIVEAAGGRMREGGVEVKEGREAEKEKLIVIGCEADKAACIEWTRAGYTVYDKEILLTGVLRQRIELDQHILYQPKAATSAAGRPTAKGRKR